MDIPCIFQPGVVSLPEKEVFDTGETKNLIIVYREIKTMITIIIISKKRESNLIGFYYMGLAWCMFSYLF